MESKTGCCGVCWINVAGSYNVWEVIAKYCTGTEQEKNMINDIFHGEKEPKELTNKYNFTEKEKEIILQEWF